MRAHGRRAYARAVLVVVSHPDHPGLRSLLLFWPGLKAPIHFLVTLPAGEAA